MIKCLCCNNNADCGYYCDSHYDRRCKQCYVINNYLIDQYFCSIYCMKHSFIKHCYVFYGCKLCNSRMLAHCCHIPIKNRYMNINIL